MTNQPDQKPAWIDSYLLKIKDGSFVREKEDKAIINFPAIESFIRQVEKQAVAAERERISELDLFMSPEVYTASCSKHVSCQDCALKVVNEVISQLKKHE